MIWIEGVLKDLLEDKSLKRKEEVNAILEKKDDSPLSIKDLKKLEDYTVWIVDESIASAIESYYARINRIYEPVLYLYHSEYDFEIEMSFEDYGKKWTAYLKQPCGAKMDLDEKED